ncbi:Hypothetical predicted protein [Mytilus galloprovincialis]|nr:Hypothetical predicted protein [Mytilus galloprovincialis]
MFVAVLSESRIRLISAHYKPEYDNNYEVENAIDTYRVRSVGLCGIKFMSNARCLSFFYNNLTGMCILHSDPFTYTVMSSSAKGWKFYLSQERAGRCLVNFFYYREFDLCYKFEPPIQVSVFHTDVVCPASEPMRIDSDEIQDYVKLVTADIGRVYYTQICIQGKKTQGKWKYNDGTMMEYFRWRQDEPSGLSNVIAMRRWNNYNWKNYEKCADRCLVNFFYYRELDLCYNFGPPIRVIDVDKEFVCHGTELVRIDFDARQDYIKLVTADIERVYPNGICIQGKEIQGNWTYIDGSTMNYFMWLPNEPSRATNVIRMVRSLNYGWKSSYLERYCTYMCEYTLQKLGW